MDRPWLAHYTEKTPREIDFPDATVDSLLEDSASRFPDRTACFFMGTRISYRELDGLVAAFAAGLGEMGVGKGTRVSICLPNCPQFVIAFYAVLRLGGIVVQTSPLYVERELEHLLNDSQADVMITLDLLYPKVMKVIDSTKLRRVVVTSIKDYLRFPLSLLYRLTARLPKVVYSERVVSFRDVMRARGRVRGPASEPGAVALIQYTGGTTGTSKGVMLTHRSLVANALQCAAWITTAERGRDTMLAAVPFFHVYGMTTALNYGVYLGATILLLPKFDKAKVLKTIHRHRPTIFPGVPAMYMAINGHPRAGRYDLTSIAACLSGAAPLPAPVKETFERLTGASLVEGYGLSEASPVTHANPVEGLNKPGSIGLPIPGTDARIVDMETRTRDLPPGEPGELAVRGPQVMEGYWRRPDDTAEVLRDGWLFTGDIAKMDEDGYFYIVDRRKEMILSAAGLNVYPREVEDVLYEHPKVAEAAVVGVPSDERGEVVKAFVVLAEGRAATEDEIRDYCRGQLAKYKVPAEVEFRDSLPKSMVGKVLKRELRGGPAEQHATADRP